MFSIISDVGNLGDYSIILTSPFPRGLERLSLVFKGIWKYLSQVFEKGHQGLKTQEGNILTITKLLNVFISAL